MKVVILAGGQGTRFREETDIKPKPMVEIGNKPILMHLIQYFAHFGHTDFIICGGYKVEYINDYFTNYLKSSVDPLLSFEKLNDFEFLNLRNPKFKVSILDTGLDTKTAERILRIKDLLNGEPFLCTYGDGLINIDINNLINFHNKKNQIATVTAVQPKGRFGVLDIENDLVTKFDEKPISNFWINAGFFVFENSIFGYLDKNQMLEEQPLKNLTRDSQLNAIRHQDFWQPMDTYRDWKILEDLWNSEQAPWKVW
jgi:glucose-1-phosphate cytidylyltransferase